MSNGLLNFAINRTVCWFSCGAASAVATSIALKKYDNCIIVREDTRSEHPDNERFLRDCEEWYRQEIITIGSEKYHDIWDVFDKKKYITGVHGAPCTAELKRRVAENFINHFQDREIFGYTFDEKNRIASFIKGNPERIIECPLEQQELTKQDCYEILNDQGILIPVMYRLGFNNNNCIGCVKGGQAYWNHIRKHFPDVFAKMAMYERKYDAAINKSYVGGSRKRLFLDELDPDAGRGKMQPISCGMMCGT